MEELNTGTGYSKTNTFYMIKVVLLGSGNIAFHLAKVFEQAKNIELIQLYRRNEKNDYLFDSSIPKTESLNELKKADVYIIAISDDQIAKLSKQLKFKEGLVVHTSGSVHMNQLKCTAHKGVFYPLQTFSKDKTMNYSSIPFCLETEFLNDMTLLKIIANAISDHVYEIDSFQREKLHIAAVFANNFSNYMFKIAKDVCDNNQISFDLLKPLISNTANKLNLIDPKDAQTGPAKRNDKKIIQKHLQQLKGDQKELYAIISKSIIKSYQKD